MNRINYGEALRRRWWLVVILGVAGLVAGLLVPSSHGKAQGGKWETFALVGSAPALGSPVGGNNNVTLLQIVYYSKTSSVILAAAKQVGIHKPLSQLESEVQAKQPRTAGKVSQQGVLRLIAVASTPKLSAAFANAYADQLGAYLENAAKQNQQQQLQRAQNRVNALESQLNAAGGPKRAPGIAVQLHSAQVLAQSIAFATPNTGYSVLEAAYPGSATNLHKGGPSLHLSHAAYGLLGLIVGLLLGAAIIVATEMKDERLRTSSRVAEAFGYPVAAEIPEPEAAPRAQLPLARTADAHAEAYRKLRMSVLLENLAGQATDRNAQRGNGTGKRQIVLVLSAADEPTRSAVVDNLAAASAEAGQRAIVVDAMAPSPEGGVPFDHRREVEIDDVEDQLESSRVKNVAILKLSNLIGNSSQLLTHAPAVLHAASASPTS
jgi:hypothetical protein